jgi:hypothetical protein
VAANRELLAVVRSRAAPVALFILLFCCWIAFLQALFNDGDTSWHLAAGQWIIDHRWVPDRDPFSFTFRNHPWTAHEWLAEVVMAAAYRCAGWAAVALTYTLCLAAMLVIIGRDLLRWLAPRYAICVLVALLLLIAPFTLARPHVMAWPLLAGWMVVLLRARERGRAPRLYWALLMLIWANLHASYLFGLMLAAVFALEALVVERDKARVVTGWGAFGLASLLSAWVTPHGLQGFLYPFQVSGMASLPLIDEWRGTELPKDGVFVAFAVVALAAIIVRWRRVPGLRVLLLAGLAWLAFSHARHQPLFGIVTVLVLARPIAFRRDAESEADGDRTAWKILALGMIVLSVVRLAMPLERADRPTYPGKAIAHVPVALRTEPVLNSYSFGGPLILSGIAPFIDGRADMYGDAFTFEHQAMMNGDAAAFERARRRWGIKWTILQTGTPLIAVLDRDPRWHRIYTDRWAVVHARSDAR